ncbi:LOW QUALITY PROTEIN: hypothetical protein SETIT_7G107400v2, partial [Setaria italica]
MSKSVAAADCGDRLSALPDELIHSIMSLLMARSCRPACFLGGGGASGATPNLDIDYREFATASGGGGAATSGHSGPSPNEVTWRKLLEFMSNLFGSHGAPILDRFQLHVGPYLSGDAVNSWIRRGTRYRPAALEITMADSCGYWFTPSLVPATACRLTRMHLRRVRLAGGFAEHLRSGCPVLEDLVLTRCDCIFQEIFSSTLKSLVIECCQCSPSSVVSRTVTAPALASFRLIFPKHERQDAFSVNGGAAGGGSRLQASITVPKVESFFDP